MCPLHGACGSEAGDRARRGEFNRDVDQMKPVSPSEAEHGTCVRKALPRIAHLVVELSAGF
jgi:hypothetical protein